MCDLGSEQKPSDGLSLAEKVVQADFFGRLALTWPLIVAMSVGVIACIGYINLAEREARTRASELERAALVLPNDKTIQRLKDGISQLKDLIPQQSLQPIQICRTINRKESPVSDTVCEETQSSAAITLNEVNATINEIQNSAVQSRNAIRRIGVAFEGGWGAAFAADDGFPSNSDKSFMLYTVFLAIIIMTIGCFFTMLISSNTRAVTYSIDALKFFGGLYSGIIGSVFGIRK